MPVSRPKISSGSKLLDVVVGVAYMSLFDQNPLQFSVHGMRPCYGAR